MDPTESNVLIYNGVSWLLEYFNFTIVVDTLFWCTFVVLFQVPVINLPEPCTPPDPEVCALLLSPYKILLPANPFCYSTPCKKRIISPHPSELPLPQAYLTNSNPEPVTKKLINV